MIVTCPNCQTRYNLPDDKVPSGGVKVKCSKCAHVFKAEAPPATPEEEVETLLEEESPAPDTQAGDDFDETFDEVAAGDKSSADESVAEEPEEAPADTPDDDLGDLFDDTDETPQSEPSAADDVDSLFGDDDDEGGLFEDGGDDDDADGGLFDDTADDDVAEDDDDDDDDEDDDDDIFADDDDDDEYDDDDGFELDDDDEGRSRKPLGCLIILLVLALGLGAIVYFKAWTMVGLDLGTYFQNVPYIGKLFMEETAGGDEVAPGESPADKVRNIKLNNVKQYYVRNAKSGNLFVVEGKAVNGFATPKERIKVEVILYDEAGQVLTSQAFLCGNVLSQFQLQVQTETEIKDGLASEVGILSNNTFIRPNASTPFMAVFFAPPEGVREFLVKVVDVGDPQ